MIEKNKMAVGVEYDEQERGTEVSRSGHVRLFAADQRNPVEVGEKKGRQRG